MLSKILSDECGYSLVEVMAAIMILSLAILPMASMFDAGLRASATGSNYDKARSLANERLEKVRALPYNKPGGDADSVVEIYHPASPAVTGTRGIFDYTVTTTFWRQNAGNPEAATDTSVTWPMMRVRVQVTWGGGKSYTTTGFVGLGGTL